MRWFTNFLCLCVLAPLIMSDVATTLDDYTDVDTLNILNKGIDEKDGTIIGAKGGTEMMKEALCEKLPNIFFEKYFQLHVSRVRDFESGKQHILWLHDLPGDPESQRLANPNFRNKFALIVFVSEWQKEQYQQRFHVPFEGSVVLRNAIELFGIGDTPKSKKGPIRLIYHTTPHRGLQILMPAFIELYKKLGPAIHLDVYSSFKIYGWESRDEQYTPLFQMCKEHPGCTYQGYKSNKEVKEALQSAHIFAYPAIWQETSCLAAIEAMSAGVEIVTSRLAALPETLGNFGVTYPYTDEFQKHAFSFLDNIHHAIVTYWEPESVERRRKMTIAAATNYDWGSSERREGRISQWIQILISLLPPTEKDSVLMLLGNARKEENAILKDEL